MSKRRAFTIVELLVVIAIIGILVSILLPAVQQARESARMTQCKNNLKQIGLAVDLFANTNKSYPPARYQPRPGDPPDLSCGGKETTWLVRIMPYLEQQSLRDRWDVSQPYPSHPDEIRGERPNPYYCPTRRGAPEKTGMGLGGGTMVTYIQLPCGCSITVVVPGGKLIIGAVGDYAANHGDMGPGSKGLPTDFYHGGNGTGMIISSRAKCEGATPVDWIDKIGTQSITDGLSYTFISGEMHVPMGTIGTHPGDGFLYNAEHLYGFARIGGPTLPIVNDRRDKSNGLVSFGSWHPGVCHFVHGDGRVSAINNLIDTQVLGNLCNRADGQSVPEDF
jgi:prepilin-type N-terminal cleavage/methylation domain-containing protein